MMVVLSPRVWEKFLADGDEAALAAAISAQSRRPPPQDVEYPEWHRICDVQLCGQSYRVSRLVDVIDGEERLFIETTDSPNFQEKGVPYQLHGEALRCWVVEESESPSKGPIDWAHYLRMQASID